MAGVSVLRVAPAREWVDFWACRQQLVRLAAATSALASVPGMTRLSAVTPASLAPPLARRARRKGLDMSWNLCLLEPNHQ
jgi:hypothetical protein